MTITQALALGFANAAVVLGLYALALVITNAIVARRRRRRSETR